MTQKDILLAMHHSLLGKITPSLRSVIVSYKPDLVLNFYYSNEPSLLETKLAHLTLKEFIQNFSPRNNNIDLKIITIPHPTRLPKEGGLIVYLRCESLKS